MCVKMERNLFDSFRVSCDNQTFNEYSYIQQSMCKCIVQYLYIFVRVYVYAHAFAARPKSILGSCTKRNLFTYTKSVAFPLYVILLYCFIFIENGR